MSVTQSVDIIAEATEAVGRNAEEIDGGIRADDQIFFGEHDGTCSRCGGLVSERETALICIQNYEDRKGILVYCNRCEYDPGSDRCRVCGCSENRPCAIGCSWAAPGLCTACVGGEN